MTPRLILIANSAGGTGKTTTAHAIATAAAEYGKRVLLIDGDPSATLTFLCGIENPRLTSKEFFTGESDLSAVMFKTPERFSFIASSSRLATLEPFDLQRVISQCAEFDLIVVDTPSNPSNVTTGLLLIADLLLVPIRDSFLSIRGALHIRDFHRSAQSQARIELVEMNSSGIDAQSRGQLAEDFTINEIVIRTDDAVRTAEILGKSVLTTSPNSDVAADYRELAYALLDEFSMI